MKIKTDETITLLYKFFELCYPSQVALPDASAAACKDMIKSRNKQYQANL